MQKAILPLSEPCLVKFYQNDKLIVILSGDETQDAQPPGGLIHHVVAYIRLLFSIN